MDGMVKETVERKPESTGTPKRGSGSSHVHKILRNEIIDLKLAPGSPMDELQLAERFALSRTPIREALVRLSVEGLITTLPNRATIVSNIDFLHLPQFFDALTLMYRVTTRLAAGHHHADDIVRMQAKQEEFTRAVQARDALALIATNRDFHLEIARAGGNSYYTELFTRLLDENRRLLRLYYSSFNDDLPRKYVIEHDQMIAAIAARDVDEADRLASAHAEQIVTQIQSYITADKRLNAQMSL
ncbi:GntR family transcriptional regulator [Pelagibacterium halotolerans]|uniref:Transcriptional regulator, GntR family n=1 Tax=Pelagibacterium halotolerans (strain DSM 22347 / JCM 15775 / CGMCC 1.7692 / B2) TaxID=1082931 RepID=G4R770_PELHB|nr:transcriptional regulator, GntR family [Pelagibacterium halotolerans B2]SEA51144.1 transcriptional regulator, GntR family [Pelagibacterium halotolerans]